MNFWLACSFTRGVPWVEDLCISYDNKYYNSQAEEKSFRKIELITHPESFLHISRD